MVYTVKKGDSLCQIATQFGVSVNDLISYNNLGTTFLQVGQQLLIPEKNDDTSDISYIVKSGDTLWSIAKKYNISVDELKSANNLSSNMLTIGQKLTIPEGNNYKTYIVKSGDRLWTIARDFGVDFQDIIRINSLNSDILSIGQTLLIP